ncbi:RmlC-like cupin [Glarea lozoyensis ATCC 20868]|uniref:RmlC-like cupin n=1 Tax=Glarea lozoyensis (strain ATCC 20868 / MF5171) TaxID=1116229 RepID=S3DG64_GLAL2|nr:RmlC-like cupin [Glarea lozoyensis ATCC 20868]EPE36124.1 RmlC-like cupin [Glarea lozoyensis ATCC 20868]
MGKSPHVAFLISAEPFYNTKLGSLQRISSDELPILKNLSIKRLILEPGSIREPHWHANCNELTYCLSGKVLVTQLDVGNEFMNFTITAGQMFFVKTGALHHIENIGEETAELIVAFRHEAPKDFSLSASFGAMSDAVLGNTYDAPSSAFRGITRNTSPKYIVQRKGNPTVPDTAELPNPHKFDVENAPNGPQVEIGSANMARKDFWPILDNMSMYSLRIEEDGMREPHWHPFTAEMGYVHKGNARMSVMDPDGSVDTYTLKPGDVYFIPHAYPHQIEVIGDEEIHFLIFFDAPIPGDVGYRTSATALSREVLAATFGVDEDQLPEFPFTVKDPLLVGRKNPVDPVKSKI